MVWVWMCVYIISEYIITYATHTTRDLYTCIRNDFLNTLIHRHVYRSLWYVWGCVCVYYLSTSIRIHVYRSRMVCVCMCVYIISEYINTYACI